MSSTTYVRYELLRTFRNRRFFIFSLVFPLVLFFITAGANKDVTNFAGTGISFALYYMVGMASWGAMAAVIGGGARIAAERQMGWNRQLRITPLKVPTYLGTKVLTGYVVALVSIGLLYLAGTFYGVRLPAESWIRMTFLILVGLLPFAILGIALGHLLSIDAMGPALGGLTALFALLGGSWGPITGNSQALQRDRRAHPLVLAGAGRPVRLHPGVVADEGLAGRHRLDDRDGGAGPAGLRAGNRTHVTALGGYRGAVSEDDGTPTGDAGRRGERGASSARHGLGAGGPLAQQLAEREGWRGRLLGLVFSGIWLLYLLQPLGEVWTRNQPLWAQLLGTLLLIAFAVFYLVTIAWSFGSRPPALQTAIPPLVLLLIALLLLPLCGVSGLTTFVFIGVAVQALWPVRYAVTASVLLVVTCAVIGSRVPGWSAAHDIAFSIGAASMAMFGIMRLVDRNRSLTKAQQELARLAIVEERERFGRDVHDLIGHSLTVITLKSDLAAKLVDLDPERAKAELADVQRLSREALVDLRATVAGYREVSLVGELSSARTALAAAGIEADLPGAVDDVPGESRELFGWVVREGVTNVVRHSGASTCSVRLSTTGVEVLDDGQGCPGDPTTTGDSLGNGLAGLRERAARAGGQLEVGPRPEGGFRLAVLVPA